MQIQTLDWPDVALNSHAGENGSEIGRWMGLIKRNLNRWSDKIVNTVADQMLLMQIWCHHNFTGLQTDLDPSNCRPNDTQNRKPGPKNCLSSCHVWRDTWIAFGLDAVEARKGSPFRRGWSRRVGKRRWQLALATSRWWPKLTMTTRPTEMIFCNFQRWGILATALLVQDDDGVRYSPFFLLLYAAPEPSSSSCFLFFSYFLWDLAWVYGRWVRWVSKVLGRGF